MKSIILLLTIAIGYTMAQVVEPVYDDDNRCNISGATLASGIIVPTGMCEQSGYVCKLASLPTGTVAFWLGKSADCRESEFYTTRFTTYYQKVDNSLELDLNHPNNKLRLVLSPEGGSANMFGVAVMASQLISAKSDRAKVSVIYSYAPPSYGADLNSIRLQSVSRVD
jgi:hypothetical protein